MWWGFVFLVGGGGGGGIFCSSFSEWIYGVYVCGKWDGKIWM